MLGSAALLARLIELVAQLSPRYAPALLGVGSLRLTQLYLSHAGLAHIQIGLMRQSGYIVPERYRAPLLARDPFDFWRRWNSYVGDWLRRYVFEPSIARLGERRQTRSTRILALLVTLAASGLLHDAFTYALDKAWSARALSFFLASGCAMVAWAGLSRLRRRVAPSAAGAARLTSRCALLGSLVWACALWGG
jgi:D-alanyl-lipoteichoic acid acyltransferase DltB (MBOAT superfamily)